MNHEKRLTSHASQTLLLPIACNHGFVGTVLKYTCKHSWPEVIVHGVQAEDVQKGKGTSPKAPEQAG